MKYSPQFFKTLNLLLIASVIIIAYSVLEQVLMFDMRRESGSSLKYILINHGAWFLTSIATWGAIYFFTRDRNATLSAFAIELLTIILSIVIIYNQWKGPGLYTMQWLLFSFLRVLSYAVFGLIHFKNKKGLLLSLASLLIIGSWVGSLNGNSFDFISDFFRRLDNPFHIEISRGENSYTHIDILYQLYKSVSLLMDFILFTFVYNAIKAKEKFDFKMNTVYLDTQMSKSQYSIVYWVLRLTLFGYLFGLASYARLRFGLDQENIFYIKLILFVFSIFVVGSIYRNTLTTLIINSGKYPKWLYIVLNIPIINLIGWIISLVSYKTTKGESSEESQSRLNRVLKDFSNNENTIIKVLIIFTLFIKIIIDSYRLDFNVGGMSLENPLIVIGVALLSMGFTIWYLWDHKSYFPLLIIQTLILVVGIIFIGIDWILLFPVAGILNLVIYYSLFHLPHINWVIEEPIGEIQEEYVDSY